MVIIYILLGGFYYLFATTVFYVYTFSVGKTLKIILALKQQTMRVFVDHDSYNFVIFFDIYEQDPKLPCSCILGTRDLCFFLFVRISRYLLSKHLTNYYI